MIAQQGPPLQRGDRPPQTEGEFGPKPPHPPRNHEQDVPPQQ